GHAVASHTQGFCELICFPHKRNLDAQLRQNNTTGKSLLIFRSRVNRRNQKYSASLAGQISGMSPPVSPDGGALANVTNARWDAMDADGAIDVARRARTAKSCGSGAAVLALSWRDLSRRRRRQKSRSPGRARSKP